MPSPETKEKARHGEQFFPLQKYITRLHDNYPAVTPHWHEEAEFTRILEGHCTYQIELQTLHAKPGDLFFIPPEVLHSITVNPNEVMRSETYVFHMSFIGSNLVDSCGLKYLTPISRQKLIPPYIITDKHPIYDAAATLFHKISRHYTLKNPGFELSLKAAFLELIALLLPFCEKADEIPSLQNEHIQKIKAILAYIEDHLDEKIYIKDLADLCFFSQYHFMRFFKNYIGMSCMEYIKRQRLKKAASLLKAGQPPLDAAITSGFNNLSYFYREFKKCYGITPKDLQN